VTRRGRGEEARNRPRDVGEREELEGGRRPTDVESYIECEKGEGKMMMMMP
jgi:hypothetical protein